MTSRPVADRGVRHRWGDLSPTVRREVFGAADRGARHPDPEVQRAVREIVQHALSRWWNRLPGWLLPACAVVMSLVLFVLSAAFDDLALGAVWWGCVLLIVVAFLCGLGGWWSLAVHRRLARLYAGGSTSGPA